MIELIDSPGGSFQEWYSLLLTLKNLRRSGWIERGLGGDSIADHSFACIAIGWIMTQEEACDSTRVIEMLVIHEIVMAKMPDVTPASGVYQSKELLEREAAIIVGALLPATVRVRYQALFSEYQEGLTLEAALAREAAKLETLLQGEAYEIASGRRDIVPSLMSTYRTLFKTRTGLAILDGIQSRYSDRASLGHGEGLNG